MNFCVADADGVVFLHNTQVADINVVIARRKKCASSGRPTPVLLLPVLCKSAPVPEGLC